MPIYSLFNIILYVSHKSDPRSERYLLYTKSAVPDVWFSVTCMTFHFTFKAIFCSFKHLFYTQGIVVRTQPDVVFWQPLSKSYKIQTGRSMQTPSWHTMTLFWFTLTALRNRRHIYEMKLLGNIETVLNSLTQNQWLKEKEKNGKKRFPKTKRNHTSVKSEKRC